MSTLIPYHITLLAEHVNTLMVRNLNGWKYETVRVL
jgi:hypothetical protein